MNYKSIYDSIIAARLNNPLDKEIYTEIHHILPRSLGGTDEKDNLVALSAREHFICHYLLAKMYSKGSFEWYKMNNAFLMMKCKSIKNDIYFNSRLYESLRKHFSEVMSFGQSGSKNSQYGSRWIYNLELEISKKISNDIEIPEGWSIGRILKWEKKKEKDKLKEQLKIKNEIRKKEKLSSLKEETENYWSIYRKGNYQSLLEFHKNINYPKSYSCLNGNFKRFIPEFSPIERIRYK